MPVRAVVFDFGSVLSRTDPAYLAAFETDYGITRADWGPLFRGPRAGERHVGERFDRDAVERYLAQELAALIGDQSFEAARRLTGVFDDVSSQFPNTDLIRLVTQLQAAELPVGILSNGPIESLELFRELMGSALPEIVVLSGTHQVRKPERVAFEAVAKALRVELGECLFVDDQEEHVEAARSLGMVRHCYRGDNPRWRPICGRRAFAGSSA
ncbi:MAG TPA: HAD-IA family hydrolase [Dehalococcoidia bacterium]|nr:HAD-IA family hydrolase [Dehalococcoidia bacterium]